MKILNNFLVLDTETTGFGASDQVIELAILDEYGKTLYASLFNPDVPVSSEAQRVNHISSVDLVQAPRFIDEWPKIGGILRGRSVLGHNIKFDVRLIRQTLQAQNADPYCMDDVLEDTLDSLLLARKMHFKKAGLAALMEHYGVTQAETHRAEDDCRQLLVVMGYLEEEYLGTLIRAGLCPGGPEMPARNGLDIRTCAAMVKNGANMKTLAAHFAKDTATCLGICVGSHMISFKEGLKALSGETDRETLIEWQHAIIDIVRGLERQDEYPGVAAFATALERTSPGYCAELQEKIFERRPEEKTRQPALKKREQRLTPSMMMERRLSRDKQECSEKKTPREQRVAECLKFLKNGVSIYHIAQNMELSPVTIASYLGDLVADGRLDFSEGLAFVADALDTGSVEYYETVNILADTCENCAGLSEQGVWHMLRENIGNTNYMPLTNFVKSLYMKNPDMCRELRNVTMPGINPAGF